MAEGDIQDELSLGPLKKGTLPQREERALRYLLWSGRLPSGPGLLAACAAGPAVRLARSDHRVLALLAVLGVAALVLRWRRRGEAIAEIYRVASSSGQGALLLAADGSRWRLTRASEFPRLRAGQPVAVRCRRALPVAAAVNHLTKEWETLGAISLGLAMPVDGVGRAVSPVVALGAEAADRPLLRREAADAILADARRTASTSWWWRTAAGRAKHRAAASAGGVEGIAAVVDTDGDEATVVTMRRPDGATFRWPVLSPSPVRLSPGGRVWATGCEDGRRVLLVALSAEADEAAVVWPAGPAEEIAPA